MVTLSCNDTKHNIYDWVLRTGATRGSAVTVFVLDWVLACDKHTREVEYSHHKTLFIYLLSRKYVMTSKMSFFFDGSFSESLVKTTCCGGKL